MIKLHQWPSNARVQRRAGHVRCNDWLGGDETKKGDAMGAYLDLWDVSDGHPEARKELERLCSLEELVERIANDGCGLHDYDTGRTCRDRWENKEEWCWCCLAKEALDSA